MEKRELKAAATMLLSAIAATAGAARPDEAPTAAQTDRRGPDYNRLARDRAYAADLLHRAETVLQRGAGNADAEAMLHAYRAAALKTLDRDTESLAALREVLALEPTHPYIYLFAWSAAARFRDAAPMLDLITLAARRVPESGRSSLHRLFDTSAIISLYRQLRDAGDEPSQARLQDALVAIDWPGENDPTAGDIFRMMVLDRRLDSSDRTSAAGIAATITGPETLAMLLVARRYEGLIPGWSRPVAAMEAALARFDATTARALAAEPSNLRYLLQRVRLLRWLGRESETLALLGPLVAAVDASHQEQHGPLLLEEAVQALLALGRSDEAVTLSARLVALDRARGGRAGGAVRHIWVLWQAGRPAESVAEAERLLPNSRAQLNDFTRAEFLASLVCGLTATGRAGEAGQYIATLRASRDAGPLSRALLCANRLDELETLTVRRLNSADTTSALLALQDYRPGGAESGPSAILYERLRAVRSRPSVQSALTRAGRVIALPLARIVPEAM
jgi:hypothetical protein